jgi:hypothetical protein
MDHRGKWRKPRFKERDISETDNLIKIHMFKNTIIVLIIFILLSSSAYGILEYLLIDPIGTHNGFAGAAAVIVDDPSA